MSNATPSSAAHCKPMPYGPRYPARVARLQAARTWVKGCVPWYTTEHRHAGLGVRPPAVGHAGRASQVTAARQETLRVAYQQHPNRFVRGQPLPPLGAENAWINTPNPDRVSAAAGGAPARQPGARPVSRVSAAKRPLDPATRGQSPPAHLTKQRTRNCAERTVSKRLTRTVASLLNRCAMGDAPMLIDRLTTATHPAG